jgi:hypothetical protein
VLRAQGTEDEIDAAAQQPGGQFLIRTLQRAEAQLRMLRMHLRNRRRQQLRARQRQRADGDRAFQCTLQGRDVGVNVAQLGQHAFEPHHPAAAGIGRHHAARSACEQRLAQRIFQACHRLADGGLRNAKGGCHARHVMHLRQQRRHLEPAFVVQRFQAGDRRTLACAQADRILAHFLERRLDLLRAHQDDLTRAREQHAAPLALEQLGAERRLQGRHRTRNGRRRAMQRLRRAPHAAGRGHAGKHVEVMQADRLHGKGAT